MAQPQIKTSTPRLSEVARHLVIPAGAVTTAWPSVEAKCVDLGISFDLWQQGLGRLMLAKRADGKYAASVGGVVLSIPRQVGKTFTIGGIVFALCLLHPGLTVIWTAHRLRTANETFRSMRGMTKRQRIKPYVDRVVMGSGEEEIRFRNDSRVLFGARERGFGLGFAGVDILVLDEAQRLGEAALDDMVPTTNQAKHPAGALLFFMGTPPRPTDSGDVFSMKRREALAGEVDDTVYVELSADRGAHPGDWDQVAKANPSFPLRTPREAILRMRRNLGAESFLREGLGIWDEENTGGALDLARWLRLVDPATERGISPVFGVHVTGDRDAWVAVAWKRPDGFFHVMLTHEKPLDAFQLADYVKEHVERWNGRITGSKALEKEMSQGYLPLTSADFTVASGGFADLVKAGIVRHDNQKPLNDAVKAAKWRNTGSGAQRAFQLTDCPEAGPLAAAAQALHVVVREPEVEPWGAYA